jgi:hypothetical protein
MTPVPAAITRPLVEGLRNEVIVREDSAQQLFPQITSMDYRTSVQQALDSLEAGRVETRWTDALVSSLGNQVPVVLTTQEGMIIEQRKIKIHASTDRVYRGFTRLGGDVGWLYFDWSWQLRGLIDRIFGGVGLRRGRRDSDEVRVGDAIDFWRVEAVEPGRFMRLRAEMKVPGRAWLQFEAIPLDRGDTQLVQTALFAPRGLFGFLYWYGLYPIHGMIFSGLIRAIKKMVEQGA